MYKSVCMDVWSKDVSNESPARNAWITDIAISRGPKSQVRRHHPAATEFDKDSAAGRRRSGLRGLRRERVHLVLLALVARQVHAKGERLQDIPGHGSILAGAQPQPAERLRFRQRCVDRLPGYLYRPIQHERTAFGMKAQDASPRRTAEIAPERELRAPLSRAKTRGVRRGRLREHAARSSLYLLGSAACQPDRQASAL